MKYSFSFVQRNSVFGIYDSFDSSPSFSLFANFQRLRCNCHAAIRQISLLLSSSWNIFAFIICSVWSKTKEISSLDDALPVYISVIPFLFLYHPWSSGILRWGSSPIRFATPTDLNADEACHEAKTDRLSRVCASLFVASSRPYKNIHKARRFPGRVFVYRFSPN